MSIMNKTTTTVIYTADEAAGILGVNVATLRRYLQSGALPARKIGRQWRITDQALNDFVHQYDNRPNPTIGVVPSDE